MNKKNEKKVAATVQMKGFTLSPDGKINHKSQIIYEDKDAFLNDNYQDAFTNYLMALGPGLLKLLKDKRVRPGSIRITFQFEQ